MRSTLYFLLGSQGFVAFRMKPRTGILPGDVITNTAEIYFDFNPPIITNTTAHTVEFSTGVETLAPTTLTLFPNPARTRLYLREPSLKTQTSAWSILSVDGRQLIHRGGPFPFDGLDVEELCDGQYILRLVSDQRIDHASFIKTR